MSWVIVPVVGAGTRADPFRPKYLVEMGVDYAMADFPRDRALVYSASMTPAQETTLSANADAIVVPPLDNTIALVATQNKLEAMSIPAGWLTADMTYRTVLRVIFGMSQYMQRVSGILGQAVTLPGNLDRTVGSFSATVQNALAQAADELGLDRSGVTGSTTVREVLRIFGQQWADGKTINFYGL